MAETVGPALREEARALNWIHEEVRAGRPLPALEAHAVSQAVGLALRQVGPGQRPHTGDGAVTGPLVSHSLNAALAAGVFATALSLEPQVVASLVMAALLADIGQARTGFDPLMGGRPSPEEWEKVRRHPVEGARVLMQAGTPFELPAVVAYEHHQNLDGSGYPERVVKRVPHFASRLVRIADVFTAMTEARPWRSSPHDPEAAIAQMASEAGNAYDVELMNAFTNVFQKVPAVALPVE
ncbi:MAG TPA: HD domain-containing phosphohydrolase [Longimicrobiales bacterium]